MLVPVCDVNTLLLRFPSRVHCITLAHSHKKIAASRASQTNINVLQGPSYTPAPVPTLTPTPAPAAVATSNSNSNNKTSTSATANSNSNSNRNSGGSVTSASVQLATAESIATSDSLHTGRKHGHSQAEHGVVPSGGAFIDDRKKALTRKARKITRKNIPDYTKRKNSEVQHRGKKTFSHIHTPRENHPAVRLKKMDSSSSHPRSHIPFGSKAVREKLPLHESVRMKGTAGQKNGYLTRSSFSFSTQPIESYKMKKAKGVTDRHRQSSFNTNPNKFRAQKKKEAGKVTWAARRSSSSVFAGENGCSDSNVASAMSTASMLTKNVTRGSPSSSKSMSKSASSPRLFTTAQQQKASAQAQAWASKRNRTSSVFQMNNRNFNGVGGGEKLEKTHAGGMFRIGEQQGAGADTAARPMTARGSGGRAQRSARGPPPSRPAVAWR